MKKKLIGILGAFVAFFASTSAIYGNDEIKSNDPRYLTFTNTANVDEFFTFGNGSGELGDLKLVVSINNGNWEDYAGEEIIIPAYGNVRIAAGENNTPGTGTIINNHLSTESVKYNFDLSNDEEITDNISASGDVTSLLNGTGGDVDLSDTSGGKDYSYCFDLLFVGISCQPYLSDITNLSLPSTKLAPYCYRSMFTFGAGFPCHSFTSIPSNFLPATTLAESCYNSMFAYCTSLINAPKLPAAVLPINCYSNMFAGCTALKKLPDFSHITSIAGEGYVSPFSYMFDSCSNLQLVETGEGVPGNWQFGNSETTGSVNGSGMFNGCTGVVLEHGWPIVNTTYCLSYSTALDTTNSLGGYYMKGSAKQAMVAFSATVAKEDIVFVTSFGFEEVDGTTIIESNDAQLAAFKTNNNGNFYTVIDCDGEGVTKTFKAFVKIGSNTTKSDSMTAESNLTNEYTIPE